MGKLLGVFYSEFDDLLGPKIVYQCPENALRKSVFDSIADYVITKPHLCNSVVSICAFGLRIMGYPMSVENEKYARNRFLYNLGIVLAEDDRGAVYEPVLRKVAQFLSMLEVDREFLSRKETKARLHDAVRTIMNGLNSTGEARIHIMGATWINLKLVPKHGEPPSILAWQVPVLVQHVQARVTPEWDLTVQQILPHINGVSHVQEISNHSYVDLPLVQEALGNLVVLGYVRMVDAFKYSNLYRTDAGINTLFRSTRMQQDCVRFIQRAGTKPRFTFAKVFALYCAWRTGSRTSYWCQKYKPFALGIDERKFVLFGVLNGVLSRVYEYPILPDQYHPSALYTTAHYTNIPLKIKSYMDGTHCIDEIACTLSIAYSEVDYIICDDNKIRVIRR